MSLSKNVKIKRKELKLSQEYIAEQLGVSRQAVSKWETGQSEPTAKNLRELADLFGISLSELIEPEKADKEKMIENKKQLDKIVCMAIGAYTGGLILSTVETNIPSYFLFTFIITLLPAIGMAFLIWFENPQVRFKKAIKELGFCAVMVLVARLLPLVVGNIISSFILCVLCVLYIKYFRFR